MVCIYVSETYSILDTLLYFDGTTDTSNWQKHSNTVITYDSEGTHMNGGGWIKLQVGTNNHSFDGTKDLRFEFDIKTPQQVQFRYINNSGSDSAIIYLSSTTGSLSDWNTVKLDYNHSENTITPIINDVTKTSASTSNTATLGLQIYDWNTGGFNNCIVKNFKVYEI